MRRRLLLAVLLAAALPLVVASAASACSYVVPPDLTPAELDRQLLRGSDAAFTGRLVAVVPEGGSRADYLFRIGRRYKGRLPLDWVVVNAPLGGGLCGLEVGLGERTGLMLDRRRGRGWTSQLILQIAPADLRRAARRR